MHDSRGRELRDIWPKTIAIYVHIYIQKKGVPVLQGSGPAGAPRMAEPALNTPRAGASGSVDVRRGVECQHKGE
jgi:hypothetical protein